MPAFCDTAFAWIGLKSNKFPKPEDFRLEGLQYKIERNPKLIPDRTIISGSVNHGGIQPHYRVDFSHPALKDYLSFASGLKDNPLPTREKIQLLIAETNRRLPRGKYVDPKYLALLRKHTGNNVPINFGEYLKSGVGVCRENAIAMHLALQEAGIPSKFLYARMYRSYPYKRTVEEHAVNTVMLNGVETVVDSYFSPFNGVPLTTLRKSGVPFTPTFPSRKLPGPHTAGLLEETNYPDFHVPVGKPKSASFSLQAPSGKLLSFKVERRNQAERKFKLEEEQLLGAGMDDEVKIEWMFHPYYFPLGHSSLRIGNRLFEFTREGWKVHEGGVDNARAHLFNNPFFKNQYQKYKEIGMPPFSLGVPIKLTKKKTLEIESNIRSGSREGAPFSILFNNCNQCLLKSLPEEEKSALEGNSFSNFSSVMTFRRLLLESPVSTDATNVYPLPGIEASASYKELMPSYLYDERTPLREKARLLKEVPRILGVP